MGGPATRLQRSGTTERALDDRELRIMMATAAYHARRVARTMRLNETDREDAEQEILLTLLDRRRFFDAARGAWSSFADRVARQAVQAIADGIANERRRRGPSLDQPVGDGDDALTLLSHVGARLASDPDPEAAGVFALSLERSVVALPDDLRSVTMLALHEDGDLGEAQRRSGLSTSEFYRRLREVRYRLVSLGIVQFPPSPGPPS